MRALGLVLALLLAGIRPAQALDGGRYGEVRVAAPAGEIHDYVVLFADRGGWTAADQAVLDALAGQGVLAVGVDTDAYLARLAGTGKPCDQLVGDAEALSRQLQHERGGDTYAFPILAGIGAGGTLARAILAQAPGHTLAGAAALDPAPLPSASPTLCAGPPGAPFGFDVTGQTEGRPPAPALTALLAPHLAAARRAGVTALPLEELPSATPSRLLAVVLSGDGGWRDLDKSIAEALQKDGVSVVGWDSLRYFWRRKTAEETAADLAAVFEAYGTKWHADRFALIGYSFGADVLPDTWASLPEPVRKRIVLVSFLALSDRADWEISVAGWLGAPPTAAALPTGPGLAAMPGDLLQCFYGAEEQDPACPALAARGADVVRTAGGHHFDGDYAALAQRILTRFRARAGE